MKNIKKMAAVLTAAISLSVFSGCSMIVKTEDKINRDKEAAAKVVLAKGEGFEITQGELDKMVAPKLAMVMQQAPDSKDARVAEYIKNEKSKTLDELVKMKVYLAKAASMKIDKNNEDVKKKVSEMKENDKKTFPTDEALKEAITKAGMTMEEYENRIVDSAAISVLLDTITKGNEVNDASIKNYYELHKDQYTDKPGAKIYHIFFKDDEAKAKEAKKKLNEGAKFEDISKEYGQDASKDKGGLLGEYAYDTKELVPSFMDHVKKLKEGEISEPVKSEFGWHIIKVTDIKTEEKVKPLEEVKENIKQAVKTEMDQKTINDKYTEWEKELKVEKFADKIK